MASMGALIMFVAFLIALIGILLRRKWGVLIIGLMASTDPVFSIDEGMQVSLRFMA
jgi:hypothetical protein